MKILIVLILICFISCSKSNLIEKDNNTIIIDSKLDNNFDKTDSIYKIIRLKEEITIDTARNLKKIYDFRIINPQKFIFVELGFFKSLKVYNSKNNFTDIMDKIDSYDSNFKYSDLEINQNNVFILDDENGFFYTYNLEQENLSQKKIDKDYTTFLIYNNQFVFRRNYFNKISVDDFIMFDYLTTDFNQNYSTNIDLIGNKDLLMFLPLNMIGMTAYKNNMLYISPDSFNLYSISLTEKKINWINKSTLEGVKFAVINNRDNLDENIQLIKKNSIIRKIFTYKDKFIFVLTFENLIMYDINGNYLATLLIKKNELIDEFNGELYILNKTDSTKTYKITKYELSE